MKKLTSLIACPILSLACMLIATSCATTKTHIVSRVTVFHKMPDQGLEKKFAFVPLKHQKGLLDYENYKESIKRMLVDKYGFIETPLKQANLLVAFDYALGDAELGGVVSSSSGSTDISGKSASHSESTTATPYFLYNRRLLFYILTKKKNGTADEIIYQADISSKGSSNELPIVLPKIIEALFQNFPGESGSVKTVSIPWN